MHRSREREGLHLGDAVAAHRAQRAVFIGAVPADFKVIVDERGRAGMQRQIPGFAALAGHLEVRHAFAFAPGVLDLELAQFLPP
jgi:hypothetical protein